MNSKRFYFPNPPTPEVADRKRRFNDLSEFVRSRHGWLTSVPGEVEVTMQVLPGSTLPEELRGLGYDVTEDGETERILAGAITEQFCMGADGQLEPLISGSTRPVAQTVTHAGIVKVMRFAFDMT